MHESGEADAKLHTNARLRDNKIHGSKAKVEIYTAPMITTIVGLTMSIIKHFSLIN